MKGRLPPEEARKAMRSSTLDGAFGNAAENASVPFMSLLALAMGASKAQIGLMAALPVLVGNLLQLPSAALSDRMGRRKTMVVLGAAGARFLYLPIALLPLVFGTETGVPLLIGLLTLRAVLGNLAAPPWTSLMADLVPKRLRGMYFANRNMMAGLAGLAATVVAGSIIGTGQFPTGYTIALFLAFGAGMVATYHLTRLPDLPLQTDTQADTAQSDAPQAHQGGRAGWGRAWVGLRSQGAFTGYLGSALIWHFAVLMPGPLLPVYYVEDLGGTPGSWGIVTGALLVTTILGQRYWGLLVHRFGERPVMLLSGTGACILPVLWFLIPHPAYAVAINLLAGFVWAGYNLAAFNLLLSVTPDRRRTTYIGGFNTTVGLGAALGPFAGGILAEAFGIRPVLLASVGLRILGLLLFRRLVHTPPRQPMKAADLLPLWFKWRQRAQRRPRRGPRLPASTR